MKRCPTCGQLPKRSNDQNKRYWAILNALSEQLKTADGYYNPDTWHLYFKQKYLGMEEVRLPNRQILQQPKSSAELDKAAFNDYMIQVEQWAVDHGVFLDMDYDNE